MNIYITIIILFILLLVSLKFSKNIFSPASIIVLSYLFSMVLIIPNIENWNVNLKIKTCIIIIIGTLSFLIGYFMCFYSTKNLKKMNNRNNYIQLNLFTKIFIIVLQLITLGLNFYYVSKIVGGITISNFSSSMEKYRELSAYSEKIVTIPFIPSQLKKITNILFYFVTYVFFENAFYKKNTDKRVKNITFLFIFTFIIQFLLSMLSAGRYNIICLFIGAVVMFTICKAKSKDNISKTFVIRDYLRLAIVLFIVLIAFSSMRFLVGRTNQNSFSNYISGYFGGSVPLLDRYLDKYESCSSSYFGYNTLHTLYSALNKLGIVSTFRTTNLEFMQSGSLNGNVYTSFCGMYTDFGILGIIVLQMIEGIIFALVFKKVYYRNNSSKSVVIFIILYCSHISSIFLHSYGENFFSLILSQSIVLELIYVLILYQIIIKYKISFKKGNYIK